MPHLGEMPHRLSVGGATGHAEHVVGPVGQCFAFGDDVALRELVMKRGGWLAIPVLVCAYGAQPRPVRGSPNESQREPGRQ